MAEVVPLRDQQALTLEHKVLQHQQEAPLHPAAAPQEAPLSPAVALQEAVLLPVAVQPEAAQNPDVQHPAEDKD